MLAIEKHNDVPDKGLWNHYFGFETYEEVQTGNIIIQHEEHNYYLKNCQFNNLINRAITLTTVGYSKILSSFCFFKKCSTQSKEGGGAFLSKFSNAIFHFCCVTDSFNRYFGSFSHIEAASNDFEVIFQTCTFASCGTESMRCESTISLNNANANFESGNFSDNYGYSNTGISSKSGTQYEINEAKCHLCSFSQNNAVFSLLYIYQEKFFFAHCNVIQNIVANYQSQLIHLVSCRSLFYHSRFVQDTTPIYCIFGTHNIINCSFSSQGRAYHSDATVYTDEIGNKQFFFELQHLILNECYAKLEKTQMTYALKNMPINRMKCSCQQYHRFFGSGFLNIPSLFFQTLSA